MHRSKTNPLCAVGRTPWSAVDPLVDLVGYRIRNDSPNPNRQVKTTTANFHVSIDEFA